MGHFYRVEISESRVFSSKLAIHRLNFGRFPLNEAEIESGLARSALNSIENLKEPVKDCQLNNEFIS